MRILITCLSQSWGGMEMYSLQTAELLIKSGFEVDLLCFPNSHLHIEAEKRGISTYQLEFSKYFSPIQIVKLRSILNIRRYDLIHAEATRDLWLVVPALKLASLKTPLLLTKHVGSYIIKKDFMHKWIYKRVNIALAISGVIKKNLIDTTPLPEEKIILLHNSIDVDRFNPEKTNNLIIRNGFNLADDEILIGMNARFSPGKGHEEFLYAANELNKRFKNIKYLVVGGPSKGEDSYETKIKEMASSLDLDGKVIFTGFRNDIPEILASLDIFVFPSHAEAFGLALVEAMSMKLPSVCSNSDGVLDIAVDRETSFLFQNENYHDLSKKLSELITHPESRFKLGNAARQRVVKYFSTDFITSQLINIYNDQINQKVV
ncbi:MAG: glycosyltransferase family 4 protein [Melioribacteraceae bacterium]